MLGHEEIRSMITAIGTGIGLTDFDVDQAALPQDHHHDRRRRGRLAHPHAAADVLLPAHAGADQARPRVHRAAAAVSIKKGKSEKYIKDDKEFTREILRRATENLTVETAGRHEAGRRRAARVPDVARRVPADVPAHGAAHARCARGGGAGERRLQAGHQGRFPGEGQSGSRWWRR